ncbi:MAG: nucleoside triphosphate pyrophosphohydrolase [Alphaproteobacteria bacterium]|nr:nucleoside triphosphate pyrophosphohydrolase [Alphaproteobacteria bacterium]
MTDMTVRAGGIDALLEIMARLRDPDGGCPWDIEQDFATIVPYTIEEAYEVADAVQRGDMAALKDELGDLLLQVVYHAQMAREADAFAFHDVVEAISAKMVRRHPHVFGTAQVIDAEAQTVAWEDQKARERAKAAETGVSASVLDGVARALPALMRAEKLQKRAARNGFDWPEIAPVIEKIEEEIAELRHEIAEGGDADRLEDEIGDVIFACVNLARHLGVDPEAALRRSNDKFERRFRFVEQALVKKGKNPSTSTLTEMDALWNAAKDAERR